MTRDVLELLSAAEFSVVPGTAVLASGAALLAAPQPRDVGPEGVTFPFDLGLPDGAEAVELDPVVLAVEADTEGGPGIPLGELPTSVTGGEIVVTVPTGRRVRGLHLADLTDPDGTVLRGESDLAGRRLSVSVPAHGGGWASPVVAVPSVAPRGQVPATLTGASFSGGVLRLPDLAGERIKVSLVDGDTPDDFSAVAVTVGKVTGWASTIAVDLTLTGPDGATLWAQPGEFLPGPTATADVTVGIGAALDAKRVAGEPLTGTITLTAAHAARVRVSLSTVTGALLRRVPGITTADLAGEPTTLTVPPLPATPPTTVVADLRLTYAGMRLADISDPLPPNGAHIGTVVTDAPVTRALPPLALRGEQVTRVGIVGFCDPGTSLTVTLAGAQAVVTPAPGHTAATTWVDLAATVEEAVTVTVSAGAGRFFWIADPEPLVRIVVVDPDPGGRPVILGDTTLATVADEELATVRAALPPHPFTGTGLAIASALFCTVEITDVELRYRRGA